MSDTPEKPDPDTSDSLDLKHQRRPAAGSGLRLNWREINWLKVGRNIALVLVGFAVLIGVALVGINTPPGRRFLVEMATGIKLNSGLQIEIGDIDGSLYGEMTLHDVRVKDTKGVFIQSPVLHLDWRPFAFINKHVDIRDVSSPLIQIMRKPVLNPSDNPKNDGPLLPDINIDINHLNVETIQLDAPVMGEAHRLTLKGQAHLLRQRIRIDALTLSEKNDRLVLKIDAAPDRNQLDIAADLQAPADGLAAGLLHFDKAFTAGLSGKGTWQQWTGRALANFGEDNLMDLAVVARDGVFHITGPTHPDQVLSGETAALLRPALHVDLTTTLKNRTLDSDLTLSSDALNLTAKGLVNLASNRFKKLELHARLLKPDALGADFTASDLRADLLVDGDFKTPRIDYDLTAKRFDLGGLKLTGFSAKGKSRVTDTGVTVPLRAQLTSLTGISPQVDPLLTHLSLQGDIDLSKGLIRSDNLRINSDRLKATASLSGDTAKNLYGATIKANLRNYVVEGIGKLNAAAQAKLTLNKGRFSATGTANAQTTQLDNEGLRKFLGGNAKLTASYAYDENGTVILRSLSGQAPEFTLLSANGRLSKKGAIALNAKASSTQYGPLDMVASGTLKEPTAVIHAASPGLGVQMVDVTAHLSGTPEGYAITAEGGSAYGPFAADTQILNGDGPLRIDIRKATFAGINAGGLLTQADSGPFTGTLAINGSGLDGTAVLSAQNGDQAATIRATGADINVPGEMKIQVGRTIISADVVLHDQMQVAADIEMADLHYQDFVLATGRAKVTLKGENGTVQAVATGTKDIPFNLALNGRIAPNLYTFNAQGAANGLPFRLNHAAVIKRQADDWVLAPVQVVMKDGSIDLSGRFGQTLKAQA
ncbi:MAG: DUF490 domain-containing protein, partial [Asticcacaulis sp.]